jgi:hypothetical protein
LRAEVARHFAHYNFVRVHKTLRVTPATAVGVIDRLWSLEDLVAQTSNLDTTLRRNMFKLRSGRATLVRLSCDIAKRE